MHAYLLVGKDQGIIDKRAKKLAKSFGASILESPVKKIGDVRELSSFIKLSLAKPTAVFIKDVHLASTEALNAFLKILEEPQEKAKFILTATSEHKLLPTIVSRCQVIKAQSSKLKAKSDKNTMKFLKSDLSEKFEIIDKIRKREEAVNFLEELMITWHEKLISKPEKQSHLTHALKQAQKTLLAINANGNVSLQLTNFVVNL